MKTKLIQVTRADIKRGYINSTTGCPVALALERAGIKNVWVSCYYLNGEDTIRTPSKVQRFMDRFDDEKPVNPFSFLLRLP